MPQVSSPYPFLPFFTCFQRTLLKGADLVPTRREASSGYFWPFMVFLDFNRLSHPILLVLLWIFILYGSIKLTLLLLPFFLSIFDGRYSEVPILQRREASSGYSLLRFVGLLLSDCFCSCSLAIRCRPRCAVSSTTSSSRARRAAASARISTYSPPRR